MTKGKQNSGRNKLAEVEQNGKNGNQNGGRKTKCRKETKMAERKPKWRKETKWRIGSLKGGKETKKAEGKQNGGRKTKWRKPTW